MRKLSNPAPARGRSGVRCAIYTRKSSEEGLDQAFNSLDAQREACEAYVLSQRHEGWSVLPQMYDDGGISGGTMERPALKRLLADIGTGKIDTVVVYKVDRLTRSLGDFAKIVEVFDRHRVSFVSITQAFNTTSSMGRLTLNMLLSFAQFEREVTGERIRDKIAASKQKGMWMGGLPPLGYDVRDRKLVVNEAEAETVKYILHRYHELGSIRVLAEDLEATGIASKRRLDRFGRETGGRPLARGALYRMLQNRIYRGEIVHKGMNYPGEHAAIVEEELWEKVQLKLVANRVERDAGTRAAEPSLLAGLIYDDAGERMTPTHANKKGTRYRYYVSQSLVTRGRLKGSNAGQRVPAGDVENLVEGRLKAFLGDAGVIFGTLEAFTPDANARQIIIHNAARLAGKWSNLALPARRAILQRLVARIDVRREAVELALRPSAVPVVVDPAFDLAQPQLCEHKATVNFSIPARLKRTGMETRFLIEGSGSGPRRQPDRSMLRLLARAQHFNTMIMRGESKTIAELASEAGVTASYFTRILRLSFLAPQIVRTILDDRHPPELSSKRLSLASRLPNNWADQMRLLRIA